MKTQSFKNPGHCGIAQIFQMLPDIFPLARMTYSCVMPSIASQKVREDKSSARNFIWCGRLVPPACPGTELPFALWLNNPVNHGKKQNDAPFHPLDGLLWECIIQDLFDPDLSDRPKHRHADTMLIAPESQIFSGIMCFRAMGCRLLWSQGTPVAFQPEFLKIVDSANVFYQKLRQQINNLKSIKSSKNPYISISYQNKHKFFTVLHSLISQIGRASCRERV